LGSTANAARRTRPRRIRCATSGLPRSTMPRGSGGGASWSGTMFAITRLRQYGRSSRSPLIRHRSARPPSPEEEKDAAAPSNPLLPLREKAARSAADERSSPRDEGDARNRNRARPRCRGRPCHRFSLPRYEVRPSDRPGKFDGPSSRDRKPSLQISSLAGPAIRRRTRSGERPAETLS
jgi:hypothetical protein